MSIFQDLCHEANDTTRRAGILSLVPDDARTRVDAILGDASTTPTIIKNPKGGISQIIYQSTHGKIILTPKGISRVDHFGITWGEGAVQPERIHIQGLYKT